MNLVNSLDQFSNQSGILALALSSTCDQFKTGQFSPFSSDSGYEYNIRVAEFRIDQYDFYDY